jgi:H+-transporting ATPase
MPDTSAHELRRALAKFWTPIPWMLEAAILLELVTGKYVESAIIAALLVFNAALGFSQESRAQATLSELKSRLALNASVRRDGSWKTVPGADLVPGDTVKGGPVEGHAILRRCDIPGLSSSDAHPPAAPLLGAPD